jgi:hypothetical protein
MIDDFGSNRFQGRCDQCDDLHPTIGTEAEVEDAVFKDNWIAVQVTYLRHDVAETKMFCPVCASIHFHGTFEEVLDPDPEFLAWLNEE